MHSPENLEYRKIIARQSYGVSSSTPIYYISDIQQIDAYESKDRQSYGVSWWALDVEMLTWKNGQKTDLLLIPGSLQQQAHSRFHLRKRFVCQFDFHPTTKMQNSFFFYSLQKILEWVHYQLFDEAEFLK